MLPICVVIVSYNRSADLDRCLRSLAKLEPAVARVLVVDNGSTDGTEAMVRVRYPWVDFQRSLANLGPCVARNVAVLASTEPMLWFLDSDTEVTVPEGAAILYRVLADNPEIGAVGGEALLNGAGDVVGVKPLRVTANGFVRGNPVLSLEPGMGDTSALAACNFMMRRTDFLAMEGYDPFYFFFYEDIDLTYRLHRAGRRVVWVTPMPVIHHYSEQVRLLRLWMHARNRMYFCLKALPWQQLLLLPLLDAAYVFQWDNIRRLLNRARRGGSAKGLVTVEEDAPAAQTPGRFGATLRRAVTLVVQTMLMILLGYAAIVRVALPALAGRFGRQRGRLTATTPQLEPIHTS